MSKRFNLVNSLLLHAPIAGRKSGDGMEHGMDHGDLLGGLLEGLGELLEDLLSGDD